MSKEMTAKEKEQVQVEGEPTRTGPVFVPAVDIFESEEGMTLLADMPGVSKENLTVDLKENTLTLRGRVEPPGDQARVIYREYEVGDYFRQFSLSEAIDQENITAALKDGVLTLYLPKARPARPRRIDIAST
ncbi:MAG: Hsp20/alpha crystallin family protein [Thermodesulfobacteriota bacterium]